jgi:hypothetical protein
MAVQCPRDLPLALVVARLLQGLLEMAQMVLAIDVINIQELILNMRWITLKYSAKYAIEN